MVFVSRCAVTVVALLAMTMITETEAFQPLQLQRARPSASALAPLSAIAVDSDLAQPSIAPLNTDNDSDNDNNKNSAMINLKGIAMSGLQGKALFLESHDFPKAGALRAIIPADCFQAETSKSLGYLTVSLASTAACTLVGVALLTVLPVDNPLTWPLWAAYSAVTGTVAMGLWVLAHECGHGAFSPNKKLQDAIGFVLHSIMLVPYYSWQRSHAVHHRYTNHMELGETHVPEPVVNKEEGSFAARAALTKTLGNKAGLRVWGAVQSFAHLVIGWPAYLMIVRVVAVVILVVACCCCECACVCLSFSYLVCLRFQHSLDRVLPVDPTAA
jgi:omega-6 fatty acid desaturase (delta-12 desaturase)